MLPNDHYPLNTFSICSRSIITQPEERQLNSNNSGGRHINLPWTSRHCRPHSSMTSKAGWSREG